MMCLQGMKKRVKIRSRAAIGKFLENLLKITKRKEKLLNFNKSGKISIFKKLFLSKEN